MCYEDTSNKIFNLINTSNNHVVLWSIYGLFVVEKISFYIRMLFK